MAKKKGNNRKNNKAQKPTAPKVEKVEEPIMELPTETPAEELTGAGIPELNESDTSEGDIAAEVEATDPKVKEEVVEEETIEEVVEEVVEVPIAEVKEEGTYKTRLFDEAVELKNKMVKLKAALENNTVPASEVEILTEQYGVMHQYAVILNTRLGRA